MPKLSSLQFSAHHRALSFMLLYWVFPTSSDVGGGGALKQ